MTVYSESKISPYEGRLNDGFFDSYLGTSSSGNTFPSIVEATNEPLSFPYGKIYLYGGEFFSFLSRTYGEEHFAQFFKTYGSYPWAPLSVLFPCTGLDIAARKTFGHSFPALFSQWRDAEKERFADLSDHGIRVTHTGW